MSDPSRSRRTRLPPEERRERILEAALEEFAQRGYNASMGDVAEAAGITRTVLYHYFPSKDGLFLSVLEAQASELLRHLAPVVASEGKEIDRARRTSAAMIEFIATKPRSWQILFEHRDDDHPEVAKARKRVHEMVMSAAAVLFASDMTAAGMEIDSERAAIMGEMTVGATVALARWWREHPRVSKEVVAESAFDLFWHGLGGLPERRR